VSLDGKGREDLKKKKRKKEVEIIKSFGRGGL